MNLFGLLSAVAVTLMTVAAFVIVVVQRLV